MSRADARRDAAALVRAAVEGDQASAEVILGNCDVTAVAVEVANLAAGIITLWLGGDQAAAAIAWTQRYLSEDEAGQ